jgi:hypothetical protein
MIRGLGVLDSTIHYVIYLQFIDIVEGDEMMETSVNEKKPTSDVSLRR